MEALEPDDPRSVKIGGRRYRIRARIGSGGMGRVYFGRSPSGRAVAIKMVRAELAEDRGFRDRFRREVEIARSVVGCEFTVPLLDADPHARVPWLATEFLPSISVRDAVRTFGALPVDAVWGLAAGVAAALQAIHGAGIVHRDLTPANVLLTPDGPRVIDFGIASAAQATGTADPVAEAGAPGFMSPEQVTGGTVGPASDIFTLGATLAYACTGTEPFGDGPWQERAHAIESGSPRLEGITDEALRAFIASCMERVPSRRPTPAQALRRLAETGRHRDAALPPAITAEIDRRRAEAENPPAARRRPVAGVLRLPRTRTHRAGAALAAVLTAAGAVGTIIIDTTRDDDPRPRTAARPAITPSRSSTATPSPRKETGKMEIIINGSGRLNSLTYEIDGRRTTLRNVRVPWRKTLDLPTWPSRVPWKISYDPATMNTSYRLRIDGQTVGSGGPGRQSAAGTY